MKTLSCDGQLLTILGPATLLHEEKLALLQDICQNIYYQQLPHNPNMVTMKTLNSTVARVDIAVNSEQLKQYVDRIQPELILHPAALLQDPKLCLKVPFHCPKVFLKVQGVQRYS